MADELTSDGAGGFDLAEEEDRAEAIAESLTSASRTFSRTLVTGMRAAVLEGRNLDSILRSAAMSIVSSAFRAGITPLANLLTRGASGLFSSLAGGLSGSAVKTGGNLLPFAKGGVIGTPTSFPLPGGRSGLMGEAGSEAILPLARGANGALGVALAGRGETAGPITINIATPDVESFRRSEAQVTATLARAVSRGRRGL